MAAGDQLIGALASGRFVSGESIAAELGITRAAVWKQIRSLRARGIAIDCRRVRTGRWSPATMRAWSSSGVPPCSR